MSAIDDASRNVAFRCAWVHRVRNLRLDPVGKVPAPCESRLSRNLRGYESAST